MTAERWARIKEIYGRASELLGETRAGYVRDACGSDAELRREVESLLEERSGSDLRSPVQEANWVGRQVAHFRILEKIGAGGMGVVWKAEDTRLKRPVALKFLATHLLGENEEKARFVREAQAAAALDHPNICTVHGIHEEQGQTFIAMAYIDGPSLADKIKERPLPLDEALDIAIQIAEGLQEAHDKGIVHRDIKPHNVMLTSKGQVKIMDFGLASLAGRSRLTKSGTTLGTPAYMAPEQLEAREVDRRADIWALSCVLYEMLAQRTPFEADYEQAVAYGILNEQPEPVTAQRAGLPVDLDRIIGKALAKHANERYQHVDDMLVDLQALNKRVQGTRARPVAVAAEAGEFSGAGPLAEAVGTAAAQELGRRLARERALFGVALVATVSIFSVLRFRPPEPVRQLPLVRFALNTPSAVASAVISPNGRYIAYVAGETIGQLWVRDLGQEKPRPVEGTNEAQLPFWSPESDFIGFATRKELKKVPVKGGLPTSLCSVPSPFFRGGTWSLDGTRIVFAGGSPGRLYQVPAQGGERELLFTPRESDKALYFRHPRILPNTGGRRALIFGVGPELRVRDLETNEERVLATNAHLPFYSPTGHILYQTAFDVASDLWALPFSMEKLEPTGEAFSVDRNAASVSIAENGTLVYLDSVNATQWQLVWRDRSGKQVGVIGQPQPGIRYPDLSPDDRKVVVRGFEKENFDVWVHDVDRPVKTRLTFRARNILPNWSPSGDQIAFTSSRDGSMDIFTLTANGSGKAEMLVGTPPQELVTDWSLDGRHILYYQVNLDDSPDLWYLQRVSGDQFEPTPFLTTPFWESEGQFSPNGRFVAYTSDESGQREVYVRPFPKGGVRWQVSSEGGSQPRWRGGGTELFYVQGDTLMVVNVDADSSFSAGSPTRLFTSPFLISRQYPHYDVSLDGQRFVVAERAGEQAQRKIRVIQNWFSAFQYDSRQ